MSKQKLELTWIGKEKRPKLEPRILLEDVEKSYHAMLRATVSDEFDNRLIFGDNLLALKALEQAFSGKVTCVYIDPPFNTGEAFEYYDDGLEHSTWLSLVRDRLEILRNLLASNGVLVLHLDHTEAAYAKVLLDEVFGRANYLNTVTTTTNAPSGFKSTSSRVFSTANQLLLYAKDRGAFSLKRVYVEKGYDSAYSKFLHNRDEHYSKWKWSSVTEVFCNANGFRDLKEARSQLGGTLEGEIAEFAIANARCVFRTAAIGGGAAIKRKTTIDKSRRERGVVFVHPEDDMLHFYILNGEQFVFYDARLVEIDGRKVPGEILTDVWTDIPWTGIASEGAVEFKNGKKPEALIKRVLEMCTEPGDLVLDSFAGSGTTGAVAHKMGRRWIMVELGEHCHTHIIPRLKKVIDGEDKGGVTESVGWRGGGGFRYYKLAPSLIVNDRWGNPVINPEYNAAQLAEALAKLEGFAYAPSETRWWQHGHSSERDFIYVTTQNLSAEQLLALSEEVGTEQSLLVCCSAFHGVTAAKAAERWPNLTLKKIPKMVLARCEWGHDDYSLNVANLPMAKPDPDESSAATGANKKAKSRKVPAGQGGLFGETE